MSLVAAKQHNGLPEAYLGNIIKNFGYTGKFAVKKHTSVIKQKTVIDFDKDSISTSEELLEILDETLKNLKKERVPVNVLKKISSNVNANKQTIDVFLDQIQLISYNGNAETTKTASICIKNLVSAQKCLSYISDLCLLAVDVAKSREQFEKGEFVPFDINQQLVA
jgi:hypothetical protein